MHVAREPAPLLLADLDDAQRVRRELLHQLHISSEMPADPASARARSSAVVNVPFRPLST